MTNIRSLEYLSIYMYLAHITTSGINFGPRQILDSHEKWREIPVRFIKTNAHYFTNMLITERGTMVITVI